MREINQEDVKIKSREKSKFWSYLSSKELDYFPSPALRWWLLSILVFAWTVEQFERAKMGPVLVYVLQDFNISLSTWGYVSAISFVMASMGAYIFSNLADRFGRKKLMLWPTFAYVFIAIGTAMAPNFSTVAVLYIFGGVVVAGMLPAVQASVRDITPRMGRALSYGFLNLAFILGGFTSNWAGAKIIPIWPGWRPQFWVAAAVALFTVAIVWLFYKELSEKARGNFKLHLDKTQESANIAGYSSIEEARKSGNLVYKDWRLWVLSMVVLFWAIAYSTILGYAPLYLKQYFGIEPAKAASLPNVFFVFCILGTFIGGWISDRTQVRKTVTMVGGVMTGIMLLILSTLPSDVSHTTLMVVLGVMGSFAGLIYPSCCAMISENAEAISPFGVARAFGIAGILSVFSGVILSLGLPFVVKIWGWSTWILITGFSCFLIAICVSFGRGPWWKSK